MKKTACATDRRRADEVEDVAETHQKTDVVLGLRPDLSDVDLKATYRDAWSRYQALMAQKLLGSGLVRLDERDLQLLDGELEIYVPPSGCVRLTGQPQVVFKPARVVIDDEASAWYDIVDVKVGRNSQLISPDRLPGTCHTMVCAPVMKMEVVQIAMSVTVDLVNVTTRRQRYPRVAMHGFMLVPKH